MQATELMPLLSTTYQTVLSEARNAIYLPDDEDPVGRLFYLATFDHPTGKFPLCKHQVECFASRLSEHSSQLNLKVLCAAGLVATICTVFLAKLAISHQNNPWAIGTLGLIATGSLITGYCYRYQEVSIAREVSVQFSTLSLYLKDLKSSDEKMAKFLADRIKVKKIDEKLRHAKVGDVLRSQICGDLRQAKKFVRNKLQLEALTV